MTIRIAMWSGPRNISTAMMRSWENRPDCCVVDEPFYAYYLAQTKSPHPMFKEVLAAQSSDYQTVANDMARGDVTLPVQYQKHMTHHMLRDDFHWAKNLKHCFLIRDPKEVVNSYTNSRGVCTANDIGIVRQAEIYRILTELTGQDIPVVDSNDVLKNPKALLSGLCKRFELPFYDQMLSWTTGIRDSDGIWADHWYQSVASSTGFAPWKDKALKLTESQLAVVEEVMPAFQNLNSKKVVL